MDTLNEDPFPHKNIPRGELKEEVPIEEQETRTTVVPDQEPSPQIEDRSLDEIGREIFESRRNEAALRSDIDQLVLPYYSGFQVRASEFRLAGVATELTPAPEGMSKYLGRIHPKYATPARRQWHHTWTGNSEEYLYFMDFHSDKGKNATTDTVDRIFVYANEEGLTAQEVSEAKFGHYGSRQIARLAIECESGTFKEIKLEAARSDSLDQLDEGLSAVDAFLDERLPASHADSNGNMYYRPEIVFETPPDPTQKYKIRISHRQISGRDVPLDFKDRSGKKIEFIYEYDPKDDVFVFDEEAEGIGELTPDQFTGKTKEAIPVHLMKQLLEPTLGLSTPATEPKPHA